MRKSHGNSMVGTFGTTRRRKKGNIGIDLAGIEWDGVK
jgi:hypothetical protein